MSKPLREVVKAELRSYSPILMDGVRYWGYEVTLACGHRVTRRPKYEPGSHGLGFGALYHRSPRNAVLPFRQRRARCELCPRSDTPTP